MSKGGAKRTWRNIYLLIAFLFLVLFAIPILILGVTGKYRLLLRPLLSDSSRNKAAVSKVVTADKGISHLSGKNVPDDDIESLLRKYTVDFYIIKYSENIDRGSADSLNSPGERIPAVEIPDTIRLIAGLDVEKGYVPRLQAVNDLGSNLSEKEVSALLYFLHKKIADDNLGTLELDAIKNDVVVILMRQTRLPGDLAPHLIAMYYDRNMDNIWRDYTIQFMGQIFGKLYVPAHQAHIRKALDAALSDSDNIPAAAIISMAGLVGNPGFDRERISTAAYRLCADPGTRDTVKTAALQICAKFKNKNVLPLAREIVRTSKNVPLKISAVAALGAFGESADRELIGPLASSGDIRIRTAARSALKKLRT